MTLTTLSRWCFGTLMVAMLATPALAAPRVEVNLSGVWRFTPDYLNHGESIGWNAPGLDDSLWDSVEVPHIWDLEPRYQFTGPAWYRRTFLAPAMKQGENARLHFGAVFYKSKVWLNGILLGEHEGGYTAFDMDTLDALKPGSENLLVVWVDNSWSTETIPGARSGNRTTDATYPWWNYGGIKKPVVLEITPAVYVTNQKIAAMPDLAAGTARVSIKVWVRNTSPAALERTVRVRVRRPGAWDPAGGGQASIRVGPNATSTVEIALDLPAAAVSLWDYDHPNLYESLAELVEPGGATVSDRQMAHFGIRKLEIRDSRLLLNGEPVSFGGANRSADDPKYGSMETGAVIDRDLSMMKTANMGLARILHYPPSQTLLDWADEHGFLLIAEAGNWGLPPQRMASESLRANWRHQTREMMEQGWNHPSIIAWSTGNEYQSDTPEGFRWTKDMMAFIRTLDQTRFTTFISLGGKVFSKVKPEENSFHLADFLCVNIYGNEGLGRSMETLSANWPGKPVLISEFGWRADSSPSEHWRAQQFREAMKILRRYPFVIGASVWTFNDYHSRFPGTNPDGYRRWGLVTPERTPRESYFALREEFSPAVIQNVEIDHKPTGLLATFAVRVKVGARSDFPSRTLRDHELVLSLVAADGTVRKSFRQPLPVLKPGAETEVVMPVSPFDLSGVPNVKVEVRQPTGFVSVDKVLPVQVEEPGSGR